MLSEAARDLLKEVLRARPKSAEELGALAAATYPAEGAGLAAELVDLGFIRFESTGEVGIAVPEHVVKKELVDHLRRQRETMEGDLQRTIELVQDLQVFAREWSVGAAPDGNVSVEFVHGPMAPRDASLRIQASRGIHASCAAIPDPRHLEVIDPAFAEVYVRSLTFKAKPDRLLLGGFEGDRREMAETFEFMRLGGVEVRFHASLPSWFAVDDDDTVVLPVAWGDHWPTSVMILNDAGIAAGVRELFEMLWTSAVSMRQDSSWRPLVDLMATGMSLPAAARTLGCSERTARRRLAEAMRHHRARTVFQLGVQVGRG